MRDIAKLNENDKKALFHNTAAKTGMTDAIIEKDFWVCYMLDYLFHRCAWKNNIAGLDLFPIVLKSIIKPSFTASLPTLYSS